MREIDWKSKEKKIAYFKELCKSHNIKLTPQRMIIYEELLNSDEHPSTDMLYQRVRQIFPTISFDTVNRTLLTFYDLGIAGIVEGSGNPKRFDGNQARHHHFQCLRCRRVIDVFNPVYDALPVPPELNARHVVMNVAVHLEGICDECKDKYIEQESPTELNKEQI